MVFLRRSSLHLTDSILCAAYRQEGPQGFFPPAPRRAALGSALSHWHSAAAIDDNELPRVTRYIPKGESIVGEIRAEVADIRVSLAEVIRAKARPQGLAHLKTILHQVTFIIAFSANATPTWSLMRFKGPGGGSAQNAAGSTGGTSASSSGPSGGAGLASALRSDSHELLLTLGAENDAKNQNQIDQVTNSIRGLAPPPI
jgi:hypothetical protein